MLARARAFFEARGVLEVDTPALSPAAVSDPNIESIRAELDLRPGTTWYLRTSPEFAMKRLLCAGYPDIYEIARVFRDGEAGPRHQPEFTLVEWYRLGFGLHEIVCETVDFLGAVLEEHRLSRPVVSQSYREAFIRHVALDPFAAELDELRRASGADERLAAALGETRDDWLDLLIATRIAPAFDSDRLTVLHHYPASQAALARLAPDDDRVAERFEVFCGELELANGFVELADAAEQAARFEHDQAVRKSRGKARPPVDRQLIAALESGLPPCAGVAVGFDRLLMIDESSDDLRRVVTFPFGESS